MTIAPYGPFRPGNRVLAAMTRAERSLLAKATEPVDLALGTTLFAPGETIDYVIFPDSGLVSLAIEFPDGGSAEVGMVGREGLIGLPALLGAPISLVRAVVQIPGTGHRIAVPALTLLADGSRNLRSLVRRHSMTALAHASLTAACHAMHPLEQRLARWLLSVQDRVGAGFPITQEYLALMVGSRRPTVNAALRNLKAAGYVRHARGRIAIADRAGLEDAACPCYHAERMALEHMRGGGSVAPIEESTPEASAS